MPDTVLAELSEARSRQFLADITALLPAFAHGRSKPSSLGGCRTTSFRR